MTLIGFLADYVEGKFNTDTDKMICVPHDKYQRVDLCMRTTGMHLPFAEIKLFVRDRYADAKEMYADAVALGEEIVRRWNAGPAVQGMWITMKGASLSHCSVCKESVLEHLKTRRCPSCDALMFEPQAQEKEPAAVVTSDTHERNCGNCEGTECATGKCINWSYWTPENKAQKQGGDEPALYHHDGIPHLINAEQKVSALTKDIDNLRDRCKRYEKQMEAAGIKHDPFDGTIF